MNNDAIIAGHLSIGAKVTISSLVSLSFVTSSLSGGWSLLAC